MGEDCCAIATVKCAILGARRRTPMHGPRGSSSRRKGPRRCTRGAGRSWPSCLFGWMQPSPPHPGTSADQPPSPDRIPARGPLTFSRQRQRVMGLRLRPRLVSCRPISCRSASARLHPGRRVGLAGVYARRRGRGQIRSHIIATAILCYSCTLFWRRFRNVEI